MRFKTIDAICKCGHEAKDVLVAVVGESVEAVPCERCGEEMTICVGAPRAIFSNGFFSYDGNPRRVEIEITDEDGKRHRKDVTHKLNPNAPGGAY